MTEVDAAVPAALATRLSLGIDGGGSKTQAVIVDAAGHTRGNGQAGSANQHAVGLQMAEANIFLATLSAAESAGCSLPLDSAWIGLAGLDNSADHERWLSRLHPLASIIRLSNDAELVLSAFGDAVGVALIAGTGAIALGRDSTGKRSRASGWGHILGDEGSGYDIGCRALQAIVRAIDGRGKPTRLVSCLMDYWELSSPDDLLARVYQHPNKSEIASLAPLVFRAAESNDVIAAHIIRRAAQELALAAVTVGDALDFTASGLSLALGGSLLLHQAGYRQQTLGAVARRRPIRDVVLATEPAFSAAHAAQHFTGHDHLQSTW
jgi:glucosamine kinase